MLDSLIEGTFAYISGLTTRVRIYKVWAAPVIEFFLLQEIASSTTRSKLESLQHKCICAALRVKREGTPKTAVLNAIYELPIDRKCNRFANSLLNIPSVLDRVQADQRAAEAHNITRTTRRGATVANELYNETNTLSVAISKNAEAWAEFEQEAKIIGEQKIDYELLPDILRELKKTRTEIIRRNTNRAPWE